MFPLFRTKCREIIGTFVLLLQMYSTLYYSKFKLEISHGCQMDDCGSIPGRVDISIFSPPNCTFRRSPTFASKGHRRWGKSARVVKLKNRLPCREIVFLSFRTDMCYGMDCRRSVPGRGKNSLFSAISRPALGPTQPPIQWVPGVKRPVSETDHSSASSN
jgi:hypothetical protein